MQRKNRCTSEIFSASVFVDDQGFWSIVVQTDVGPRAYSGDEAMAIAARCRALGIPVETRTSFSTAKALDAIAKKIKHRKEKEAEIKAVAVGGFKP